MCVVALVIMTETTGDMIAVGEIVDQHVEPRQLADGLRADGLSTLLGGIFNTSPNRLRPERRSGVAHRRAVALCGHLRRWGADRLGTRPEARWRGRRGAAAGAGWCRHRPLRHGGRQRRTHIGQGEVQQHPCAGRCGGHRRGTAADRGADVVRRVPHVVPSSSTPASPPVRWSRSCSTCCSAPRPRNSAARSIPTPQLTTPYAGAPFGLNPPRPAPQPSRSRKPLARLAGRATARRIASSVPNTRTLCCARVTAV